MNGPLKRTFQIAAVGAIAAGAMLVSGCGEQKPLVSSRASELFNERCSGCHTLDAAASKGSNGSSPTGPDLDFKPEDRDQVLYTIRNGGFSGAIMPQNIVVGKDAEEVADFVAKHAGSKAKTPPGPKQEP